jgi:hypothetical protein
MSSGRVIRPKTGVVGGLVGLGGGAVKVLEYLHLMDFVHGLPHNEFIFRCMHWLLGPEGTNLAILVGFALIVWAIWPRSEAQTADPLPNIIVLECGVWGLDVNQYGIPSVSPNANAAGTVVTFRNDAVAGRSVGSMHNTKAHVRVKIGQQNSFHVNAAIWLGADLNTVNFAPSDTRALVLAVATADRSRIAFPDDRRESAEHYDGPVGFSVEGELADVHVKLVGGWNAQFVYEFDFTVWLRPKLGIVQKL